MSEDFQYIEMEKRLYGSSNNSSSRTIIKNILLITLVIGLIGGITGYIFNLRNQKVEYIELAEYRIEALGNDTQKESFQALPLTDLEPRLEPIASVDEKKLQAKVVYAYDLSSGQVLVDKNGDLRVPIASLTKLMSGIIAYREFGLNTTITLPDNFPLDIPNGAGLLPGDSVNSEELLQMMIVASKNDTSEAFAHAFPGGRDAFVLEMNEVAKEIGMVNTSFSDPSGLEDFESYSTAEDLRILVDFYLQHEVLKTYSGTGSAFLNITALDGALRREGFFTTNKLLNQIPNAKGLKTGYTLNSGECLIFFYADQSGNEIITILLNADNKTSRFLATYDLIAELHESYDLAPIYLPERSLIK